MKAVFTTRERSVTLKVLLDEDPTDEFLYTEEGLDVFGQAYAVFLDELERIGWCGGGKELVNAHGEVFVDNYSDGQNYLVIQAILDEEIKYH
jgi:hypothetical protein